MVQQPVLSLYSLLEMGIEPWLKQSIYFYLYKAYTVSLAPILTIFHPILIMRYALESSHQVVGPEEQY